VVIPAALSRAASVSSLPKSKVTSTAMPVTPVTGTFEMVLCQPVSASIRARRPMARATASPAKDALQLGQIIIISRSPKLAR
jgi:hypothetical protein